MLKSLYTGATGILLAACATKGPPPVAVAEAPPTPLHSSPSTPPRLPSATCYAASSSDWNAWVNAMPGPGARPTLIVAGKVTTPTGGHKVSFEPDLQIRESLPVQVVATLRITSSSPVATMAFETYDVRGEWPLTDKIGSLTIRCGEETLAVVSPVETAH